MRLVREGPDFCHLGALIHSRRPTITLVNDGSCSVSKGKTQESDRHGLMILTLLVAPSSVGSATKLSWACLMIHKERQSQSPMQQLHKGTHHSPREAKSNWDRQPAAPFSNCTKSTVGPNPIISSPLSLSHTPEDRVRWQMVLFCLPETSHRTLGLLEVGLDSEPASRLLRLGCLPSVECHKA